MDAKQHLGCREFFFQMPTQVAQFTTSSLQQNLCRGQNRSIKKHNGWAWWYIPIIPTLSRLRKKNL
jgi:hypothetical protein